MVICKYFNQGYCRYGSNCHFEHSRYPNTNNLRYVTNNTRAQYYNPSPTPSKQFQSSPPGGQLSSTDREIIRSVSHDMDDWLLGKMWPFSVYAPLKEGENFPIFEDASPEELRWNAYQTKDYGITDNYISKIKKLGKDIQEKRLALKKPNKEMLQILHKIFQREKLNISSTASCGSPTEKAYEPVSTFKFQLPSDPANPQKSPMLANQSMSGETPTSVFSQSTSLFGGTNEENVMQMATSNPQNDSQSNTSFSFAMEHHPSVFGNASTTPVSTQSNMNSSFANYSTTHSEMNNNSLNKTPFSFTLPNQSNCEKLDRIIYSMLVELSEEEKQEFEAKQFTLGKIPDVPPPLEVLTQQYKINL